jgi:hypothetical protein
LVLVNGSLSPDDEFANERPALSVHLPEDRPVVQGEIQSGEDQHGNGNLDRAHNLVRVRLNCNQFVAVKVLALLFIIQKQMIRYQTYQAASILSRLIHHAMRDQHTPPARMMVPNRRPGLLYAQISN